VNEQSYLELFANLDRASEPSRELDLAIHQAVFPDSDLTKTTLVHRRGLDGMEGVSWDIHHGGSVVFEKYNADAAKGGRCFYNGGYPLPAYTSSIDAALKLIRKHYLWQLKQGIECTAIVWWLEKDWDDTGAPTAYSTTYPALALTKAALLARAVEDRVPLSSQKCGGDRG
jgi:hypothetical protein